MARYIPLDALVAEIERIDKSIGCDRFLSEYEKGCNQGKEEVCDALLSFIDTLEAKEVNFEAEWKKYFEYKGEMATVNVKHLAKHFFELGLKARTDKELVEEAYSHLDSIKDTADRMTSGNFMHNRAAIKFSANTIAKVLELMGLKIKKGE